MFIHFLRDVTSRGRTKEPFSVEQWEREEGGEGGGERERK